MKQKLFAHNARVPSSPNMKRHYLIKGIHQGKEVNIMLLTNIDKEATLRIIENIKKTSDSGLETVENLHSEVFLNIDSDKEKLFSSLPDDMIVQIKKALSQKDTVAVILDARVDMDNIGKDRLKDFIEDRKQAILDIRAKYNRIEEISKKDMLRIEKLAYEGSAAMDIYKSKYKQNENSN